MSNLDIDAAIAAHTTWVKRLRFHLDGITDNRAEIDQVGDHTRCVLGRWLYGSGADYDLLTQYHELLDVHREFHCTAAQVVELHGAGRTDEAEALLDNQFTALSRRIVSLLNDLKLD